MSSQPQKQKYESLLPPPDSKADAVVKEAPRLPRVDDAKFKPISPQQHQARDDDSKKTKKGKHVNDIDTFDMWANLASIGVSVGRMLREAVRD
ncbi:hypothetical protein ACHAQH_004624 [Verticillium albo-atrum]